MFKYGEGLTPFPAKTTEDKYQNLIEHLNDGFVLVNTELDVIRFNPAFARIMEYEPSELVGMNALQVARGETDRQALRDGIKRRKDLILDSYEVTFVAKSGRYIPAYVTPTPYVNDMNEVIGSFAIIQDLTQIKQARSTIKYQSDILENVSEGIIVADLEGNIRYCNCSVRNILGIESGKNTGRKIHELNVEGFTDDIASRFDQLLREKAAQWEIEIRTKEGINKFVRISTAQLKNLSNDIDGLVMIISDFTELQLSKQEAQTANQAKSRFLAMISHDIRTPMIGIIGASDLLSLEDLTAYQQELIFTLKQCSQQLIDLINDVMDISRIEAGIVLIDNKVFNLHQLLDECTNTIDISIKKQGIVLIIDTAPEVPAWLVGDPVQIRRVIVNLLHNAAKFTASGYIILKVQCIDVKEPGFVTIQFSVKDTGKGIPKDELHRVFDAFHQVGDPAAEGIGLGLAICRQLVELMGGHIWVESEINQGTTFSFTLILKEIKKSTDSANDNLMPKLSVLTDKSKKSIMVVDDNQMNRKLLAYMLHKAGYNIAVAESGHKCLELLENNKCDLILMDMQMPMMNGYETTRLIKKNPLFKDIPIVALTAHAMADDADMCRQAGCDGYLAKPVTSTSLYNTLDKFWLNEARQNNNEEIFKQLLPEFKSSLQELGYKLKTALNNEDYIEMMSISHDIKGMAGIYGYLKISQLAGDINIWARRHDFQKCTSVHIALQEEMNRLFRN